MIKKVKKAFEQVLQVTEKICKENGGNKFFVILDIIVSIICYGASPNNYYYFGFYKIPAKKRKTYVTHRMSRKVIRKFNDSEKTLCFEKKEKFNEIFSDFTKREFLNLNSYTEEEFEKFFDAVKNDEKVIYKPSETAQGQGIIVIEIQGKEELRERISSLDKNAVLEQWIVQDKRISDVFADAVNCLRIITLLNKNKVYILAANITFGNKGDLIANASLNTLVCIPEIESGIVSTDARNIKGELFSEHPVSKIKFKGFEVPYWNEVLSMCEKAARRIPQVGYIGWDVAISPDGPVIIEGNTTPGYKFFQLSGLTHNQVGLKKRYLDAINGK